MSAKFLGIAAFSSDIKEHKFYFQPMNTMANFTLIFTFVQALVCAYCLISYSKFDDIFPHAGIGAALNVAFIFV
jgi:hypothetical protein